jgi:Na+-transporting methylmalonyl-CoA/oxaloacetate decarboxylase gamma subunit
MYHVGNILFYCGMGVVILFSLFVFVFVMTKIVVSAFYETKAYYLSKQKLLKERYKNLKGDVHE